jgi:hypothetical protein
MHCMGLCMRNRREKVQCICAMQYGYRQHYSGNDLLFVGIGKVAVVLCFKVSMMFALMS